MRKVRIYISGRVQGVGFRYITKQKADEIGITGIVRNEDDGSVYVEAIGTEAQMAKFLDILEKGPTPYSRVDNMRVVEDEMLGDHKSFRITN